MKIEKISNSQIRCILTGEDLASRQLRLSELAYGSEKARALFRDMMEQAAIQCGFDAENYPLMIEAIPLGSDSIVLIVTKVDNPDELDTRFSNFAPSVQKDALPAQEPPSPLAQLLSSLRRSCRLARSSPVRMHRIWLLLIFSIFMDFSFAVNLKKELCRRNTPPFLLIF